MARKLVLAMALALAACGGDPSGPRSALPSGACMFASFFYVDTSWGFKLGPELSDTLRLNALVQGPAAVAFTALVPKPINVTMRTLDDSVIAELDFIIVAAGEYSGLWLLERGKALWVFMPSSALGMDWVAYAPWDIEDRVLVAAWRGTGWALDARVACR